MLPEMWFKSLPEQEPFAFGDWKVWKILKTDIVKMQNLSWIMQLKYELEI